MRLYREEFNSGMSKSPEPTAYLAITIQGLIEVMKTNLARIDRDALDVEALTNLEDGRDALEVIYESLTKGFIKCVNDSDTKEALDDA